VNFISVLLLCKKSIYIHIYCDRSGNIYAGGSFTNSNFNNYLAEYGNGTGIQQLVSGIWHLVSGICFLNHPIISIRQYELKKEDHGKYNYP